MTACNKPNIEIAIVINGYIDMGTYELVGTVILTNSIMHQHIF